MNKPALTRVIEIEVQFAKPGLHAPSVELLSTWAQATIDLFAQDSVMTIRVTDEDEMRQLNRDFRNIDKTSNVLSFPAELPAEIAEPLLGDIVICATIVEHEASAQKKSSDAHWAHMVIHGTLHLLGHYHIEDEEAEKMETLEINLLSQFGYANPYVDRTGA